MNCHGCSTALAIASGHCRYRISTKAPALTSQGGWIIKPNSATRTSFIQWYGDDYIKICKLLQTYGSILKQNNTDPVTQISLPVCIQAVKERCLIQCCRVVWIQMGSGQEWVPKIEPRCSYVAFAVRVLDWYTHVSGPLRATVSSDIAPITPITMVKYNHFVHWNCTSRPRLNIIKHH